MNELEEISSMNELEEISSMNELEEMEPEAGMIEDDWTEHFYGSCIKKVADVSHLH